MDDVEEPDDKIVLQTRCVFCAGELYLPASHVISRGEAACHLCGKTPPVYRDENVYFAAVREARRKAIERASSWP